MVIHTGIRDIELGGGYDLASRKNHNNILARYLVITLSGFKKSSYGKVVPITKEDYLMKPKFNNIESYVRHREENMPGMVSLEQSKKLLNERRNVNARTNTERAFRLIKRDEEIGKVNKNGGHI